MENEKIIIQKLKNDLEKTKINNGKFCIVETKILQEFIIQHLDLIKKNNELQNKIDVYKSYRHRSEEFEID